MKVKELLDVVDKSRTEANAIINGNPSDMIGATLYLVGFEHGGICIPNAQPCSMCARLIKNARIKEVISWQNDSAP